MSSYSDLHHILLIHSLVTVATIPSPHIRPSTPITLHLPVASIISTLIATLAILRLSSHLSTPIASNRCLVVGAFVANMTVPSLNSTSSTSVTLHSIVVLAKVAVLGLYAKLSTTVASNLGGIV